MSLKSVLLVLVGAAAIYAGTQHYEKRGAATEASVPPGIPEGAPTYAVMTTGGPAFHVTPATRARIDRWSTEKVVLFGATWCSLCAAERKAFQERGIRYFEVDVDRDPEAMRFMVEVLGAPAVPATVFGTRFMPGYNAEEFQQILRAL